MLRIRIRDLDENDIASFLESKYQMETSISQKLGQSLTGASIANLLMLGDLVENRNNPN